MGIVHGVAGYMSGCRCELCWDAQRAHERRIGLEQSLRWGVGERYDGTGSGKPRRWSDAEIAVMARSSETAAQIAAQLGRTPAAIYAARQVYRRRRRHEI